MGRLLNTAITLVVVLLALFGGTLAYKHLTGKTSVADDQPPLSSWTTITAGSFSLRLPRQPVKATGAPDGVTTTLFSLGADLDSLVVSVARPPEPPSLDALVRSNATGSHLQVAETTPTTVGGSPAEAYRLTGTSGDQAVSAFGVAIVYDGQAILVQYDVGGHPTATPAFVQKVLRTATFT